MKVNKSTVFVIFLNNAGSFLRRESCFVMQPLQIHRNAAAQLLWIWIRIGIRIQSLLIQIRIRAESGSVQSISTKCTDKLYSFPENFNMLSKILKIMPLMRKIKQIQKD